MRTLTARLLLAAVPLAGLAFTAPPAAAVCNQLTYELGLGCDPLCPVVLTVGDALGQEWACMM